MWSTASSVWSRCEQAVRDGARTPEDVVASVYAEVDRSLWPAAEQSVRAQLRYLDTRG